MDIIDYRNVEVRQEDMYVLGDVTFTVQEGDFVYLIGKVGSGKSSLFKTLYCELDVLCPMPDSHAIVLGMDLMEMKNLALRSMVMHNFSEWKKLLILRLMGIAENQLGSIH
jgi:ABC-type cobalamin/Fe3+-siderophores transport system ATPase subunit